MEEFIQSLKSISWWMSAVVVAVLVNVASAYLKGPLDRFMSSLYQSWQNRSAESRARYQAEMDSLINSPTRRDILWRAEMRGRLRSGFFLALSCFLLLAHSFVTLHGFAPTVRKILPGFDPSSEWPALVLLAIALVELIRAEFLQMRLYAAEQTIVFREGSPKVMPRRSS